MFAFTSKMLFRWLYFAIVFEINNFGNYSGGKNWIITMFNLTAKFAKFKIARLAKSLRTLRLLRDLRG